MRCAAAEEVERNQNPHQVQRISTRSNCCCQRYHLGWWNYYQVIGSLLAEISFLRMPSSINVIVSTG